MQQYWYFYLCGRDINSVYIFNLLKLGTTVEQSVLIHYMSCMSILEINEIMK